MSVACTAYALLSLLEYSHKETLLHFHADKLSYQEAMTSTLSILQIISQDKVICLINFHTVLPVTLGPKYQAVMKTKLMHVIDLNRNPWIWAFGHSHK